MAKKYFKNYTNKDLWDADEFVNSLESKDIPKFLNEFPKFRKSMEVYVNQNDQYRFNRLVDEYFKTMKYGEKYTLNGSPKGFINSTLRGLCRTIDQESPIQNKINGISAMDMLRKYHNRVEINVKYNIDGYSPEEVYERIEGFSDGFISTRPNLVNLLNKKWNNNKNLMNFKFESRGKSVGGITHLNEGQLIINSYVPQTAKDYTEKIVSKIITTLDDLFPKREKELKLTVPSQ